MKDGAISIVTVCEPQNDSGITVLTRKWASGFSTHVIKIVPKSVIYRDLSGRLIVRSFPIDRDFGKRSSKFTLFFRVRI
jgi:hypothetical protein